MRHKILTALTAVLGVAAPLVAGAAVPAYAAEAEIPDPVIRGGVVVYKYDAETRESTPQAGASLAGGEFTIRNDSENPIVYIDEFGHKSTKAVGETWTIRTVWDEDLKAYVAKTPTNGLPYGTYHVQETKASDGYGLADDGNYIKHNYIPSYLSEADRKWVTAGYDFTITEDGQVVTYSGETSESATPGCYNPPIRGGIEVVKRDHDLLRPSAQGNAGLEGGVFEIYNWSDNDLILWDHFDQTGGVNHGVIAKSGIDNNKDGVPDSDVDEHGVVKPGGKVATIVTGTDGRAQTFMDALPVGWYKVIEVKAPKGYALEKRWEAYIQITEDDWDALVVTDCDNPVLRGGVQFKKSDADFGYDSTEPQGDAELGMNFEAMDDKFGARSGGSNPDEHMGAVITIYNESTRGVYINDETIKRWGDDGWITYTKGWVEPGEVVATVLTDEYGYASVYGLPYGHYRAVETTASEGYNVNTDWVVEFDIDESHGGTLTDIGENIVATCCGEEQTLLEPVIRGNIELAKKDWETGEGTALGGATLAGAEFSVTNVSDNKVYFNEQTFEVGEVVTTLVTDEEGYARVDGLPYGTYLIRETKAPEGYVVNNQWFALVVIREEGVTVSGTEACPDSILTNDMYHGADGSTLFPNFDFSGNNNWGGDSGFEAMMTDAGGSDYRPSDNGVDAIRKLLYAMGYNPDDPSDFITIGSNLNDDYTKFCAPVDKVSRNDLRFNKVDEDGSTPLANIPFVLRSKTTGEWHVLVTDENGIIDTTAWMPDGDNLPSGGDYTWNLHSKNTNASDAAVTADDDGTFTVTDAAALNPDAGIYFFGSADADRGALDYVSALPYDDYELIELRVDGNQGRDLIRRDITLKYPDNDVVDLGTLTNNSDVPPVDCPPNGTTIEAHKTVDAGNNAKVELGQELTFTITYKNTGAETAEHVRIRDYVADGYEFASAENGGVYVSAEDSANGRAYVEWVTDAVEPGAEGSVSFVYRVSASTGKSVLANQAYFDAETGDITAGDPENDDPAGRTNIVYNTTDGADTPSALDASKWVEGTADDGSASIGDTLTYHVKVTNVGGKTSGEIQINDIIPTGTTLATREDESGYDVPDISDGGTTVGNYAVAWTLPALKPGESHEVWFRVVVSDNAYSVVRNSATYGEHCGIDVGTGLNNKTNTVETPIIKHPDLTVEKSADAEKVSAGQIVTYTIKVTNNGHGNATNVDITDYLPENVHYVVDSMTTEFNGRLERTEDDRCALKWTVPSIAHDGGSVTVTFQVHVDETVEPGQTIVNSATATPEGEDAVNSNEVTLEVIDALAGLDITKSSDIAEGERVNPGDEIHYTIEWTNNGETPIFNLGVRDEIPEHTTFVDGSVIVTGADGKTSTEIKEDNEQDGDESDGETDGGGAAVGDDDCPMWGGGESVGSQTNFSQIREIISEGDAETTVSGDDFSDWDGLFGVIAGLKPGESVELTAHHESTYDKLWKITIQPDGSALLVFAFIADSVTDGPNAALGNGITGNYDSVTDAVYAIQNELKPGESGKLEFTVKVDEDVPDNTVISNHATYDDGVVGMPTGDLEHETNTVETLVGAPDLTGEKTVDKTVVATGSTLTYTVKVTNNGTGVAKDVVISDTFRAEAIKGSILIPSSVSVTGGTSAEDSAELIRQLTQSSDTVTVRANELPAGETMTLTFSVRVVDADAGDVLTNKASFGDEGEADQETNEVTTKVAEADLHISALSDPTSGSSVERGDTITYTWVVTNDSDVAAEGVAVNAVIPENATYVDGSATGGLTMVADGVLGVTGLKFEPHEAKTFTAKVTVNDVAGDAIIRFRATTGFSSSAELPLAIDSNEIEHTVAAIEANLKISAEADPAAGEKVAKGDTITYTVRVSNDTRIAVDGIAVRTEVPAHATLVSGSATGGLRQVATTSDGRVVLGVTGESFDAFETKTYTFQVKVADDAVDDETIAMRATCGIDTDVTTDLPIDSGELVHTVNEEVAHLSITETADPEPGAAVERGETITYTVRVMNDGNVDASGVAVNTAIDTSTTFVEGSATGGLNKLGYDADKREILGATGITIPVGATREFTYKVTVNDDVKDGTIISNRSTTGFNSSAWQPLDVDSEEIKHGVSVEMAELSITASADPKAGSTIKPGQTVTYTFEVENTSDVDATGVAVNTNVPEYTTLDAESLTNGLTDLGDGVLGATGINIAAHETATFSFAVRVQDDIPPVYTLQMRATTGFSDDATKPLALDSNEVDHNIEAVPPQLSIVLEQDPADGAEVAPGDILTYTITVTNEGDSRARNVGIYDIAPFNTTLVEGSFKAGSEDDTTHIIEDKTFPQGILCVMAGDLEPGETATMTYQVKIDLDFTGKIRNQALWVSPAADPDADPGDEGMSDFPFEFGQDMSQAPSDDESEDKTETKSLFGFLGVTIPDGSWAGSTDGEDPVQPGDDDKGDTGSDSGDTDDGGDTGSGSGGSNDTEADVKPPHGGNNGDGSSTNTPGSGGSNDTEADTNKPQIELLKSSDVADGAYVRNGDVITYTISAENVGQIRANNMVIEDTLPSDLEFVEDSVKVSGADFEAAFEDGTIRATGVLNAGEKVKITFQARVTATDPTVIGNTATWYQQDGDTKVDGGDSNTNEVNVSEAVIELVKSADVADGAYVRDGSTITYTIRARNMGSVRAYPQVTDVLPEGFTLDESSLPKGADYDAETRTITFAATVINPGESVTYEFSGTVNGEPDDVIANRAGWIERGTDESGESNDHEVTIGRVAVDMVKSADVEDGAQVKAGDVITYTLALTNVGTLDAAPVVSDVLPEGLGVDVESLPEGAAYDEEARTVTFAAVELPVGEKAELTFKATVADGLEAGARLANTATWTDGDDTGSSNTHEVVYGQPAFTLVKSADVADGAYVKAGQVITYTLTLTNTGDAAGEATVTDTLPEGVTLDESSLPEGAAYDAETRTITFAAQSLEPEGSAELSFKVTVDEGLAVGTVIVNRASFGEGDTDVSNDHEVKVGEVDATMIKTASVEDGGYVKAGDVVTYTLTITNTGQLDFTPVFNDQLPEGMEFVAEGAPEGLEVNESGLVTFVAPDMLKPGDSATLQIQARVSEDAARGTELVNTAAWGNNDGPENGKSNSHKAVVGVTEATLQKTSDIAEGSFVNPGDQITYTIHVQNTGDFAFAPVVTDKLPEGVTVDTDSLPEGTATAEDGTLTFPVSELEPGASADIVFAVTVNDDVTYGQAIANTAHWGEDGTDNGGDSNTNEVFTGKPVLNVTKTSDVAEDATVKIGDTVTYTVTIENRGTANGTMVVTDQLPEGLTLNADSLTGSWAENQLPEAQVASVDESTEGDAENTEGEGESTDEEAPLNPEDPAVPGDVEDDDMLVEPGTVDLTGISTENNALNGTVDVAAGTTVTLTYTAKVTGFIAGETDDALVNVVSVQIDGTDEPPATDDDTVTVDPGTDDPSDEKPGELTVEKQGLSDSGRVTDLYTPGDEERYAITVENGTDEDMADAIVEDAAGNGLIIKSVTDEDGNAVSAEIVSDNGESAVTPEEPEAPADGTEGDATDEDVEAIDKAYEDLTAAYNAWLEADADAKADAFDDLMAVFKSATDVAGDLANDGGTSLLDLYSTLEVVTGDEAAEEDRLDIITGDVLSEVETALSILESHVGDSVAADEATDETTDEATDETSLDARVVRWTTGELKAGERRTYYVTVDVAANATDTIKNVANVYGADLTKPLDTSTCVLNEADTFEEVIKKGSEDLPTTGIAIAAVALVAGGAAAVAYGKRMVNHAAAGDDTDERE